MSRYREEQPGYKVIISQEWLADVAKFAGKDEEGDDLVRRYQYSASRGKIKVDVAEWKDATLKKLADYLDTKVAAGDRSAQLSRNVLQQWIEIKGNPSGSTISKFENLAEGLRNYIKTSEHRWVFHQMSDGNMLPWFVDGIKYHPPSTYSQAHVSISLTAINSGYPASRNSSDSGKSVSYNPSDFDKNLTMGQQLEIKGLHLETPARVASYEKEAEKFLKLHDEDGLQLSVKGKAFLQKGWSESGFRTVEKSGRPAKMVVDPGEEEGSQVSSVNCEFWDKNEDKLWKLPVHPVLDCFDLEEHADYRVHVNNAEVYVYDTKVGSKLVLPQDVKDFIEVLIDHSKNSFVDIVGGKEGGTIMLLEGLPGTGKTLTAEVYSEVMERPLYKVQSSQLGITPGQVEEQLKEVLQRAERWGAILLIDEADVYVHERGDNIVQNAIVGVFLRVLEYYRGVLFMTTNRGTMVDDAIISRLTARFMYETPSANDQIRLWKILSEQNGIDISDHEIDLIVAKNSLSSRDIKNLLKMAFVSEAKKGGKVRLTYESVARVAKFKQTPDRSAK